MTVAQQSCASNSPLSCAFCKHSPVERHLTVIDANSRQVVVFFCSECKALTPMYSSFHTYRLEAQTSFHEQLWADSTNQQLDSVTNDLRRMLEKLRADGYIPGRAQTDACILDVGSGRGCLLRALLDEGYQAIGCEPSSGLVEMARRHLRLSPSVLWNCDGYAFLNQLFYRGLAADSVFLWHVLEHVAYPIDLLRKACCVLRSGATLLAQVPLLRSHYLIPEHLSFISESSAPIIAQMLCLRLELCEQTSESYLTLIFSKRKKGFVLPKSSTSDKSISDSDSIMTNHVKNIRHFTKQSTSSLADIIVELSEAGGGICIIAPDVPRGRILEQIPDNVCIVDFRYGGRPTVLHGNHPRQEGIWTQYSHLQTGLARNFIISDVITNSTPIEDWRASAHEMQPAPYGLPSSSEDYRHQHNHYQNLLSEVYNFSDSLNGVAIWGDSAALVPGAKSWGAFCSARSWPLKWADYTPQDCIGYDNSDFDAALVGIEIDVLNGGKDWRDISPALKQSFSKIGAQIVGFGKRNTAAIEIRSEDSDDPTKGPKDRRGAWEWAIIVRNALHDQSTLLHCENGEIKRGIDLSLTSFREGAVVMQSGKELSGIVFDAGAAGQIYADKEGTLVLKGGLNGVRVEASPGEYLSISAAGEVSMSANIRKSLIAALGL
jgi:2-polyprenyl-3-methyl-5-hydroxy-6-metoxy-1,4-benzoquinol methylase